MTLFLLSVIVIGVVMLVMAVGVIFRYRCLRGSCGGAEVFGPDGEPLTCDTCPNRETHSTDDSLGTGTGQPVTGASPQSASQARRGALGQEDRPVLETPS